MKTETSVLGTPVTVDDGVEIVSFDRMFMADWDMPHESHLKQSSVTVPNRQYVVGILSRDVFERPERVWQLYKTPAGCRAFLTSRWDLFTERRDLEDMRELWCDPLYRDLTKSRGVWNCRVGPKPGREGDFVAEYWMTVRGSRGAEDDRCLEAIGAHDALCSRRHAERCMVRMCCALCKVVREDAAGFGYSTTSYSASCPLCLGRGRANVPLDASQGGFVAALEKNQVEAGDMLVWSDAAYDAGAPEHVVENLRLVSPWQVSPVRVGHGSPKPVKGRLTDWSTAPSREGRRARLFD